MLKITFPYSEQLLNALFREFGWDFERMLEAGGFHPATCWDCEHENMATFSPHVAGNMETGVYQNAADSCRRCYPGGNAAALVWGGGEIELFCESESSKPERALVVYQEVKQRFKEEMK